MIWVQMIAGLVLLVVGADALIRGALATARRMGVSDMMAGFLIMGFGTSLPELTTSVGAALSNHPGLALGNVVGSNLANILLILGAAALIHPMVFNCQAFRRDAPMLLLSTALLTGLAIWGQVSQTAGFIFVTMLIGYVAYSIRRDQTDTSGAAVVHLTGAAVTTPANAALTAGLTIAGLAALLGGAHLLVNGAISLARMWGVTEGVIGLTVVAIGTSLPELAASAMAAMKREGDVAFGNIVGSNIFNILGILGVTAIILPLERAGIMAVDVGIMAGATVLLVVLVLLRGRMSRIEGGLFLAAYCLYLLLVSARHLEPMM